MLSSSSKAALSAASKHVLRNTRIIASAGLHTKVAVPSLSLHALERPAFLPFSSLRGTTAIQLPVRLSSNSRVVDKPARDVEYDEVKKLLESHDPNTVLVDVREPHEYEDGHIPGAVNIPFKSMPGALGLDPAEFEQTLGFEKPDTDKQLLFYCLGGVRSTAAEQLANTYNYGNRLNYKGSYADWLKHEPKQDAKPEEATPPKL